MNHSIGWSKIFSVPLEDAQVQAVPWWLYLGAAVAVSVTGAVISLLILPYRNVQTGKSLPQSTVDRMMTAKDAEIERLHREVERWASAFHISDAAYKELSQSAIVENTDAMRALAPTVQIAPTPRTGRNQEAPNASRRRDTR